ncbi:formate dehydrogenase subunit delta [Pseudomonas sp. S9]|uniref:formate dehydrogenase subunit delta n=1 Tax=Pseudomonas sp. S9 TaxID=686578 RepID=UPI0002556D69|nr:formate dehydrogenase subunit delta [Pseudomonas sp. S9]
MSSENLVKMANQIAQFFASETDTALAVRSVQQHLQSYWTPAMRHDLSALQAQNNLHPLVKAALSESGGV